MKKKKHLKAKIVTSISVFALNKIRNLNPLKFWQEIRVKKVSIVKVVMIVRNRNRNLKLKLRKFWFKDININKMLFNQKYVTPNN